MQDSSNNLVCKNHIQAFIFKVHRPHLKIQSAIDAWNQEPALHLFSFWIMLYWVLHVATSDSSQDSLIKWYLLQLVYKNLKAFRSSLNHYNSTFNSTRSRAKAIKMCLSFTHPHDSFLSRKEIRNLGVHMTCVLYTESYEVM